MYPAQFEYHEATSVDEALDLLEANADAETELLAGGHSLIPTMKSGLASPDVLIDLGGIDGLRGIERGDGVTTIGGNLAHADPASDLPAAALAADATLVVQGRDGERSVAADDFFLGMYDTAVGDDELVTRVEVPHQGDGGAYVKKPSPSSGYAMVGVAAVVETDGDQITGARVAANGALDHAARLGGAEDALVGQPLDAGAADAAAEHATDDVEDWQLMDDLQASAEFRGHLLGVYAGRAVAAAIERAG